MVSTSSAQNRASLKSALGNPPFPWQERLLEHFMANTIPRALDLPTGLGKTSVMAIWLVARACGASQLPRRLVYVVDRRAIVDQATTEAIHLREWATSVADSLGLGDRPLPLSTLRGQFADNREWLEDPSSPAIIVGTVDMVGSRLLFEGYACSRKMRPYHAGLLGCDTLFVLDEAHLVPPFERLLEQVCAESELWPAGLARLDPQVSRPKLMSLSATGRQHAGAVLRLSPADEINEVVARRLHATKRLAWEDLEGGPKKLADTLASKAWAIASASSRPVRVIVFTNKRDDAEAAKEALLGLAKRDSEKGASLPETELFVGGRRGRERGLAEQRLRTLGFLAGANPPTDHAFVFATSAGEVGVDLDADHAVADVVAWERMVQRLGRVNRRGEGVADVHLVADPESAWSALVRPVYDALPTVEGNRRCGSSAALSSLQARAELHDVLAAATTPEPAYPPLELPIVESWTMTSLRDHTGRPEVQPWLRGWELDDPPQTTLVWRAFDMIASLGDGLDEIFAATPPHASERLEAETFRVAGWLRQRVKAQLNRSEQDELPLSPDSIVAISLNHANEAGQKFTLEQLAQSDDKRLQQALAGQTLVVDARLGGLSHDGLLNASSNQRVPTGETGDPAWDAPMPFRIAHEHTGESRSVDKDWRERLRIPYSVSEDSEQVATWLVVYKFRSDSATEEDRSTGHPQSLVEHQSWAANEADRLARTLGLPSAIANVLAIAARLHDEGKRADRWQRAFSAPRDDVYAKTLGPLHSELLDGYRHELGSLPLAQQDPAFNELPEQQRDLVLHLIAAHHGHARPTIETAGCDDAPPSIVEARAAKVALRFVELQSQLGPWRLAWLEALLRAADQRASRANEQRGNR